VCQEYGYNWGGGLATILVGLCLPHSGPSVEPPLILGHSVPGSQSVQYFNYTAAAFAVIIIIIIITAS